MTHKLDINTLFVRFFYKKDRLTGLLTVLWSVTYLGVACGCFTVIRSLL